MRGIEINNKGQFMLHRSRLRLQTRPLLLLTLTAAFNTNAHAENEKPPAATVQLAPVVVTGQGDDVTIVRARRIELEQATSLRDLFKQAPEVNVVGGPSTAQKLFVRGINERMLNITIDGATQPEAAFHHTSQVVIEPDMLKRVEIEAGAGAATAGPGALAGAIRFTTKNADDMLRPGERFGALLKGGYQSAGDGSKFSATGFGRFTEDTSVIASINRLKSSDYRDGNGNTVENSAADTHNEFVKLNTKMTDAHRFGLSHERHQDEGLRNRAANLLSAPFNPIERQRTERESTAFSYDYDPGQPLLKARLGAYVNEHSIDLAMDTPTQERNGVRSKGLNLSNISHFGQHKLTYGFDYRRVTGEAQRSAGALPDEKATVDGLYVQDDYAFAPSMLLTTGVRHDRYDYTDTTNQRFRSDGFSPSASLSWAASDNLAVRLSHARALRGVGIVEPYLRQIQTNDSDISPEKGKNTELGMQWQSGPWHLQGAVFRQRIDHFIGYETSRRNLGDVRVNGYNARVGYQAGPWSSSIGVAHAKPTLNDTPLNDMVAMQLGNSTGRTWITQLDYVMPSHNVKMGWTGRYVEELTQVAEGARAKPGYAVHDVYAQLLPTGKDDFSVTLTVKNLFDRYYLEQASFGYHPFWGNVAGFPEPGRDVRLMLAWRI